MTAKEKKKALQASIHRGRRDKFASSRPYLFGRVPTTTVGGYCETCYALVDQVHNALSQDVEDARTSIERGVKRDLRFDVAAKVAHVCWILGIRAGLTFWNLLADTQGVHMYVFWTGLLLAARRLRTLFPTHPALLPRSAARERTGSLCHSSPPSTGHFPPRSVSL